MIPLLKRQWVTLLVWTGLTLLNVWRAHTHQPVTITWTGEAWWCGVVGVGVVWAKERIDDLKAQRDLERIRLQDAYKLMNAQQIRLTTALNELERRA